MQSANTAGAFYLWLPFDVLDIWSYAMLCLSNVTGLPVYFDHDTFADFRTGKPYWLRIKPFFSNKILILSTLHWAWDVCRYLWKCFLGPPLWYKKTEKRHHIVELGSCEGYWKTRSELCCERILTIGRVSSDCDDILWRGNENLNVLYMFLFFSVPAFVTQKQIKVWGMDAYPSFILAEVDYLGPGNTTFCTC